MKINTEFLKATGIRAARTFFQTFSATIGVTVVKFCEVDWIGALSLATTAAIFSLITSFVTGLPETED